MKSPSLDSYGPCPTCRGDDVYAYTRWHWAAGEEPKARYSYIECNDCRTVSYNTTDTFTWEQVLKDWEGRRKRNGNRKGNFKGATPVEKDGSSGKSSDRAVARAKQ